MSWLIRLKRKHFEKAYLGLIPKENRIVWAGRVCAIDEAIPHVIPFGSRNTSNLLALFRPGFFKKWFRSYGYATIFWIAWPKTSFASSDAFLLPNGISSIGTTPRDLFAS